MDDKNFQDMINELFGKKWDETTDRLSELSRALACVKIMDREQQMLFTDAAKSGSSLRTKCLAMAQEQKWRNAKGEIHGNGFCSKK